MSRAIATAALVLGLWACGGASGSMAVEETKDILAAAEAPAEAEEPAAPGTIRREDLDAFLAQGPAALLARVETAPVHRAGRFAGFRIVGFPRGAPRTIDLRPGDVVVRVNGRDIERPEQYFEAFGALSGTAELRFEILRDGEPAELVYPVTD